MTRRTKLILFVMALVSVLGLTVATNAWFVSVSATPPGKISSALVQYLPDGGKQTIPSILDYGNLISGSGADTDGVALVLPGDRLLPMVTTTTGPDDEKSQTVRTSIARPFEAGETVDTVIHWELRTATLSDLSTLTLTSKQRDLMRAGTPMSQWYKNDVALSEGEPIPSPPPADYIAETTTAEAVATITYEGDSPAEGSTDRPYAGRPAVRTTTSVTTLYTPRSAGGDTYKLISTTANTVVQAAPEITPADPDGLWATATKTHTATETVIFVDSSQTPTPDKLPTRSLLLISPLGSALLDGPTLPLVLENHSTVDTNVRIGLNATVTTPDATPATVALEAKWKADDADKTGTCYLGITTDGHFIELLAFSPAAGWVPATKDFARNWVLWDLTTTADGAATTSIPPITTAPVRYPVTADFGIVSRSAGLDSSISDALFETLFNQLYCEKIPTITIHLSYYVRQAEFMDWTEFYSTEISMTIPE